MNGYVKSALISLHWLQLYTADVWSRARLFITKLDHKYLPFFLFPWMDVWLTVRFVLCLLLVTYSAGCRYPTPTTNKARPLNSDPSHHGLHIPFIHRTSQTGTGSPGEAAWLLLTKSKRRRSELPVTPPFPGLQPVNQKICTPAHPANNALSASFQFKALLLTISSNTGPIPIIFRKESRKQFLACATWMELEHQGQKVQAPRQVLSPAPRCTCLDRWRWVVLFQGSSHWAIDLPGPAGCLVSLQGLAPAETAGSLWRLWRDQGKAPNNSSVICFRTCTGHELLRLRSLNKSTLKRNIFLSVCSNVLEKMEELIRA